MVIDSGSAIDHIIRAAAGAAATVAGTQWTAVARDVDGNGADAHVGGQYGLHGLCTVWTDAAAARGGWRVRRQWGACLGPHGSEAVEGTNKECHTQMR